MNYIGIDIGSSSTKGVLVSDEFKILKSIKKDHQIFIKNKKSTVKGDLFYKESIEIIRELVKYSKEKIGKITFSGFESISFLDKNGNEIFPSITYLDTRADSIIPKIQNIIEEDEIIKISRNRISSIFEGYKLLLEFFKNQNKFKNVFTILDVPRYVVFKLTGNAILDKTTAMLFAPFFHVDKDDWNYDFIRTIKLNEEIFPELREPFEIYGNVKNEIGNKLNIKDAEILVGTQDTYSQMLSMGLTNPNESSIIYGTTAVFDYIHNGNNFNYNFVNTRYFGKNKYILEAAMFNSGSLLNWLSRTCNKRIEDLDKMITNKKRPSNIITIPFFSGERAPIWNNQLKGSINFLQMDSKIEDIYLSFIESIGYWLNYSLDILKKSGIEVLEIHSSGGGSKSNNFLQIISDITGKKQIINEFSSAEMGDVLFGFYSDRIIKNFNEIKNYNKVIREIYSINENYIKYAKSYRKFIEIIKKYIYKI